jgi:hypothetical protein
MAVTSSPHTGDLKGLASHYPNSSLRFDWAIALASSWYSAGLYLDGWAHNNLPSSLETFFTPWHAVLYSGFLAVACLLMFTQARNMASGYLWYRALPKGYFPALLGIILFGFSATADFVWHMLFGIEANIEALFSPTHLLLATGSLLYVSAPLRSAWARSNSEAPATWQQLSPAILSLLLILSILTFFTQYAHFMHIPALLAYQPNQAEQLASFYSATHQLIPNVQPSYFVDLYGVISSLAPTLILLGGMLLMLHRWHLPPGTVTFVCTINTVLIWCMKYNRASSFWILLLAVFAAGLIADSYLSIMKPSTLRIVRLRIFAFLIPFSIILCVSVQGVRAARV